jgi:membrane-bound metal-dependent hydrolase YbcI (DUF457 family)
MRKALALGCLATVAAADYTLHRHKPRWLLIGLFDHPAHLATAGLLVLNAQRRPPRWTAAFLVGSLVPDLDHPRPVSHCLLAVAPLAAAAAATQSERLHGAACGMVAHYARDLGVGSGVPLLWPATSRSVRVPYAVYAGGCVALAGRALARVVRSP